MAHSTARSPQICSQDADAAPHSSREKVVHDGSIIDEHRASHRPPSYLDPSATYLSLNIADSFYSSLELKIIWTQNDILQRIHCHCPINARNQIKELGLG